MARKLYTDRTRINFNVERELKEQAEEQLRQIGPSGMDLTTFLTLCLEKLAKGKVQIYGNSLSSPQKLHRPINSKRAPVE